MTVQEMIDALQTIEDKSQKMILEYDARAGARAIHSIHMYPGSVYVSEESTEDYSSFNPNSIDETEDQYVERIKRQHLEHAIEMNKLHEEYGSMVKMEDGSIVPYRNPLEMTQEQIDRQVKFWKREKEETKNEVLVYIEDSNNDY